MPVFNETTFYVVTCLQCQWHGAADTVVKVSFARNIPKDTRMYEPQTRQHLFQRYLDKSDRALLY